jgi:hypothetical protein
MAEYPLADVKLHAIPLGRCGTIPASLAPILKDLGLPSAKATCIAEDLHVHAVHWLEQMFNHRNLVDAPHHCNGAHLPNLNPLRRQGHWTRRPGT